MKKILIISIESNAKAYTPAGKEMRLLAKKLAENNEVTLLTTYSLKEELAEIISCDNLKIDYIKNPRINFHRFFKRQKDVRSGLGEVFLKIYYSIFKKYINRINHKPFYAWLNKQSEIYDVVISVSHPFLNHDYANQIIRNNIAKGWHMFFLDPFSDAYDLNSVERVRRREKEISYFEQGEKVFTTQAIFNGNKELFGEEFKSKTVIIPDIFIYDKTEYNSVRVHENVRVGYLGSFLPKIREPYSLFEMLLFLPKNITVDIFYGGCETIVEHLQHGDNIRVHDLIKDDREYKKTVGEMDILINIGNLNSNQIASKIYDYIGFGKPIVHFYQNEDDYTIMKFSSYPNIKFLDYRLGPKQLSKDFLKACLELKGKAVSYKKIKELFADDSLDFFIEKHYNH